MKKLTTCRDKSRPGRCRNVTQHDSWGKDAAAGQMERGAIHFLAERGKSQRAIPEGLQMSRVTVPRAPGKRSAVTARHSMRNGCSLVMGVRWGRETRAPAARADEARDVALV